MPTTKFIVTSGVGSETLIMGKFRTLRATQNYADGWNKQTPGKKRVYALLEELK